MARSWHFGQMIFCKRSIKVDLSNVHLLDTTTRKTEWPTEQEILPVMGHGVHRAQRNTYCQDLIHGVLSQFKKYMDRTIKIKMI